MAELIDDADHMQLYMDFEGGAVWSDYRRDGQVLALTHVEADPVLRGKGAAGQFMQAAVDWARAHEVRFRPVCGYAVAWFRRHPETADVVTD